MDGQDVVFPGQGDGKGKGTPFGLRRLTNGSEDAKDQQKGEGRVGPEPQYSGRLGHEQPVRQRVATAL